MNLSDGAFLVLDIGTCCVRALGMRIKSGRITASDLQESQSPDKTYAVKTAVDALEENLGLHFDSAFVTGDFGQVSSNLVLKTTRWPSEHKISGEDIYSQISSVISDMDSDMAPLHIIPMRYDVPGFANVSSPIGHSDKVLTSVFSIISSPRDEIKSMQDTLRQSQIESAGMYEPMFLIGNVFRDKTNPAIIIDLGARKTSVSLWTVRGPVFLSTIPVGGDMATNAIASGLGINWTTAERIKRANLSIIPSDMNRFTPADSAFDFSRADVNDIAVPIITEIIDAAAAELSLHIEKYTPSKIYLFGGGCAIEGINELVSERFGVPVENLGADAAAQACKAFIWNSMSGKIKSFLARQKKWDSRFAKFINIFKRHMKKKKAQFIPIMPSTLSFDMTSPSTYTMFESANISMIHCDIMDGFYVGNIAGSIEWLRNIRYMTKAHLHVHLMTESPVVWAAQAIEAGADTIILSTGTAGVRAALIKIKEAGKRSGIALHPETAMEVLKPVLRDIDEVLIMSVIPGASGQTFIPETINRIRALANTRKKYNLKFKISVDGGINPENAKLCWEAGADFLVSGNYLKSAPDFPLAVQSLLKKQL